MHIGFWAVVIFLAYAGSASAEAETLVGNWYMEGVEDGLHAQFITQNKADGTFSKEIRDITNCASPHDWTESGTWSSGADRYNELTQTVGGRAVNPSDPFYNDSFAVTWTDSGHISLHDNKTGVTWHAERVAADFRMPLSSGCSV